MGNETPRVLSKYTVFMVIKFKVLYEISTGLINKIIDYIIRKLNINIFNNTQSHKRK